MTKDRKLQEIAGSLLVTVPKDWADKLHLKKGSVVHLTTLDNGVLAISPEIIKKDMKMESSIEYDPYFPRRFLREYFLGNEKITVYYSKKTKENTKENQKTAAKQETYRMLKKFMNVQVIEETDDKIVVKCFKIDELSIKECLNRMHHLCMSLFDEEISSESIIELDTNIIRFYYLLVMQVRRYIDEGKFTEHNSLTLIAALDCRMVAEKIRTISELLKEIRTTHLEDVLINVKKFYSDCFYAFNNGTVEKAVHLHDEEKRIVENLLSLEESSYKKKDCKAVSTIKDLRTIVKYARSIAMLTK